MILSLNYRHLIRETAICDFSIEQEHYMTKKERILKKIEDESIIVGIIGLGYVGLPLAVTFAKNNIYIIGFEKSFEKIEQIRRGCSYIDDIDDADVAATCKSGYLRVTSDFTEIAKCEAILICVPTPLDQFKEPDMSHIKESCKAIARNMQPGTFICLESTTYPTTTEDFLLPILENESGMTHENTDFWLAFSPERVDPGNTEYTIENTPKVFGAVTDEGKEIGIALYSKAIRQMHPVSSPRVAEMVKILENTYRLINISLINELALLSGKMKIDMWEVIEAAKTKPYGFHPFYPGPGIGGHCIPLDPFYLEYIAKKFDFDLTMIHTAGHIENLMAHRMAIKIASALNSHEKCINGSRILFVGAAYKADISDFRESPAVKIMREIIQKGGKVEYYDPHVPSLEVIDRRMESINHPSFDDYDLVVITANHSVFNFEQVYQESKLIVDLKNTIKERSEKVFRL